MFTPINIMKKWAFDQREFRASPVNRGYQYVNPAKIPNTAPILST